MSSKLCSTFAAGGFSWQSQRVSWYLRLCGMLHRTRIMHQQDDFTLMQSASQPKQQNPFCFKMLNDFVNLVFLFIPFLGLVQDPGWSWRWTEARLDQSSPPPRLAQQLACCPSLRWRKRRRWWGVWSTSLRLPPSTTETWRRSCWTPSTSPAVATPPVTGGVGGVCLGSCVFKRKCKMMVLFLSLWCLSVNQGG